MTHSGPDHDLFDIANTFLVKVGEPKLSEVEREQLSWFSDSDGWHLCKCQVTGSMRDGSETMAEIVARGRHLAQALKYLRKREENRREYEEQPGADVISVDFRNRVRLPNH